MNGERPLPPPPTPPPCRVQYHGSLSSFSGPEDEFEKWKATPKQKRIAKLEPWAQGALIVLLAVGLFGGLIARALS